MLDSRLKTGKTRSVAKGWHEWTVQTSINTADPFVLHRILITGVNGFTGRHLAAALSHEPTAIVCGTGRRAACRLPCAHYRPCDVTDMVAVQELVAWAAPDIVYHLAGCQADAAPDDFMRVNVGGFEHLRDALRPLTTQKPVRMLVVGSAAEIGQVPAGILPIDESVVCQPTSPYGQSKHALVQAALAEPAGSGLEIVVARPFNLIGAGVSRSLAPGRFATAVRAVAKGEADTIVCRWLGGRRDYLDIRDAVEAYQVLVAHAPPGTLANVCSGHSVRTGDLLERLMTIAGVTAKVIAEDHPRPHDIADIRGSHALLTALTGWQPQVPLEESIATLYFAADGS